MRQGVGAEALRDGEQVGQHLARVGGVGERVHHRHVGPAGHLLELGVGEGADHDGVDVAGQHAGGVLDGLTAPELRVARARAPPWCRPAGSTPTCEGHAGAGGGLLEDEGHRPAGQRARAGRAEELPLGGALQQLEQLLPREVGQPAGSRACAASAWSSSRRARRRGARRRLVGLRRGEGEGGGEPDHVARRWRSRAGRARGRPGPPRRPAAPPAPRRGGAPAAHLPDAAAGRPGRRAAGRPPRGRAPARPPR